MDMSVVLCTYNRAQTLRNALECFCGVKGAGDIQWELIVVDNNSNDETKAVIEELQNRTSLPLRYSFEAKQGLSHARQNGIAMAKGAIIAFTDDDVLVEPSWIRELWSAFARTNATCVGGPVEPCWDSTPPEWVVPDLYGALALLDLGERELVLDRPRLWGANMAFQASVFGTYQFDTRLGRTEGKLYAGEETDLMRRVLADGGKLLYCPAARVRHVIPRERLRKGFFRKWRYDQGELKAQTASVGSRRQFLRVPLYMWRMAVSVLLSWMIKTCTFRREAFVKELELIEFLGFVGGRWRSEREDAG